LLEVADTHISTFRKLIKDNEPEIANSLLLAGFAHLCAGGMMAITAGVLPFLPTELADALMACLMVARQKTGYSTVTVLGLQRRLREHLYSDGIASEGRSRFIAPADKDGFWCTDGTAWLCTVHSTAFRRWFPVRAERIALLQWLHKAGHLRAAEQSDRAALKSGQWTRQVMWPDGVRHRSYVFREPSKRRRRPPDPQRGGRHR
jgi:hypothetical protein